VRNSVFDNNQGMGSALWTDSLQELVVEDSTFTNNRATAYSGGAINVGFGAALVTARVSRCTFTNNSAYDGGAITGFLTDLVTIEDSVFEGNSASMGGAVLMEGVYQTVVRRNVFVGNSASFWGGAYAGMDENFHNKHLLTHNLFVDNHSTAEGGAVAVYNWVYYPPYRYSVVTVAANTFVANSGATGSGVWSNDDTRTRLFNNIFSYGAGPGAAVELDSSRGGRNHNLWFRNTGGDLEGARKGALSIEEDPAFVAWSDDGDHTNDDFSLLPLSPAIDAGHPGHLDADLTVSDIGWTGAR
jgi:predicted outer membrane repeat protein